MLFPSASDNLETTLLCVGFGVSVKIFWTLAEKRPGRTRAWTPAENRANSKLVYNSANLVYLKIPIGEKYE
jgi:hypothetical protein